MKKLFLTSNACNVIENIAKQIDKTKTKLVFINTAAEVEEGDLWWLKADRDSLIKCGYKVTDYTFTKKSKEQVENDLKDFFDIIFVSGGNVFYLLEKIQESGAKEVIQNFVENGKIYIGSSAGSAVTGPDIYPHRFLDDMSMAPNLNGYKGLELVDFTVFPHWGSENFRVIYQNKSVEHTYNKEHKLILLNDNQYIKVIDDMYKIEEVEH